MRSGRSFAKITQLRVFDEKQKRDLLLLDDMQVCATVCDRRVYAWAGTAANPHMGKKNVHDICYIVHACMCARVRAVWVGSQLPSRLILSTGVYALPRAAGPRAR
jgi:hypothetical protein